MPASIIRPQSEVLDVLIKNKVLKDNAAQTRQLHLKSLVIEFVSVPNSDQLEQVSYLYKDSDIYPFTSFTSPYFDRLYQFEFQGDDELAKKLKEALESLPFINNVERDFEVEGYSIEINPDANKIVNDSFSLYQWGLINNGQTVLRDLDDIHLESIKGKKGVDLGVGPMILQLTPMMKEEIIVAVLDSGFDYQHPDLKNNVFKNEKECNSRGEPPFRMKEDLDGNGFKGDCIGWNFTSKEKGGDNKVTDLQGHGTHVAGIMAAELDNALGVSGISNKIKILPIKVLGENEGGRNPNGSLTSRIAKGILYATKMGAKVINMSLGWPIILDTKYLREAFDEALKAKVTIVAAAGNNNNNSPVYPCAYKNVICVGSISNDGSISHFSNYGGYVNLLAPGDNILSTFPLIKDPSFFSVKGYEIKNGTSQASPYVAGAVAVLKGIYPEISEAEIKGRLFQTAYDHQHFIKNEKYSNFGLLNLKKAIEVDDLALVVPEFKDLSAISVNGENGEFEIKLNLVNLGEDIENVRVAISITEKHFALEENNFTLAKIKKSESYPIFLRGKVLNSSLDNALNLNLTLTKANHVKNYQNEFKLSQSVTGDDRFESLAIEELEGAPAATARGNNLRVNIKTVSDPLLFKNEPEYYLTKENKEKESIDIHIFKKDTAIFKNNTTLSIPKGTQVLFIQIMDLDGDENGDYFIGSIAKDGESRYLQLSFFDENGTSLYGDYGHWKISDSVAFLEDLRQTAVIKTQLKGHGEVGTIAFFNHRCTPSRCNLGMVPVEDQDPDPWKEKDFSKGKHFFFFSPVIENGSVQAKVRVMDNFQWTKTLKRDLKLSWNDNINILDLLPQSKAEQSKGMARGVISVGKNFFTKGYTVEINSKGLFRASEIRSDRIKVEGNSSTPVIDISSVPKMNSGTSFSGIYDPTTIRFSYMSGVDQTNINLNNTPTEEVTYKFRHKDGKICLTGDLVTQKIYQFDCDKEDGKTLQWKVKRIEGTNSFMISERDQCVSVPEFKWYRSWDSFAYKKKCNGGKDQRFELIEQRGSVYLKSTLTNKCLTLSTKRARSLHDIIQKKCKDSNAFQWEMLKITNPIEGSNPVVLGENSFQFQNSTLFKVPNKRDHIIRLISSFKKGELHYNLLETKSNLKVHIFDSETETSKVLSKTISRFSFLPGSLFSESLYPVVIGKEKKRKPALYIDATQISRGDIYVLTLNDKDQLVSPIKYNIRVPNNCRPMNPIFRGQERVMHYTLFCKEESSTGPLWILKYLKVD